MKIYPKPVEEYAISIMEVLDDEEWSFFEDPDNDFQDINKAKEITYNLILEYFLPLFIKGEELVFQSAQDIENILERTILTYTLDNLIKKGLVNHIDNEDGEELIFLTEKGKNYVKSIGIDITRSV